jgi:hypothetical protein
VIAALVYGVRAPSALPCRELAVWLFVLVVSQGQWLAMSPNGYALPFTVFTVVWAYTLVHAMHARKVAAGINAIMVQYDPTAEVPTFPQGTAYRMLLVATLPFVGPPLAGMAVCCLGTCAGPLSKNSSAALFALFLLLTPLVYLAPYLNMLVILPVPVAALMLGAAVDPRRNRDARAPTSNGPLTMPQIADSQQARARERDARAPLAAPVGFAAAPAALPKDLVFW